MAELWLVLGMHRSGTSAIARALPLFGGELGNRLLEAAPDNPKGFFEDQELQSINDSFLEQNGSSWDAIYTPKINDISLSDLREYQEKIWSALKSKLCDSTPFIFKDPRMCRLWPFWLDLFSRHEIHLRIVWIIRKPLSVAQSLFRRDHMPLPLGVLLWDKYHLDLLGALRHCSNYAVIAYESLLSSPAEILKKLAQDLAVPAPDPIALEEYVRAFLEPTLNHESADQFMDISLPLLQECQQRYLDVIAANNSIEQYDKIFDQKCLSASMWQDSLQFYATQRDSLRKHARGLDSERTRTHEYILALEQALRQKENEQREADVQIQNLQTQSEQWRQQVQSYQQRITHSNAHLRSLEQALQQKEIEQREADVRIQNLQTQSEQWRQQVQSYQQHITHSNAHLRSLEQALQQKEIEQREADVRIQNLQTQSEQWRQQVQSYQQRIIKLESLLLANRIQPGTWRS